MVYLEVCRAPQGRPSHRWLNLWRFHGTKQGALGLELKNLHFSPALIILWETLSISSLSVQPLFRLNVAESPTWPEDVLILGVREAWRNEGLVKWIFLGSLWKMRQPCRCTAQISLQENLPWGVQLAVSPQLLHLSALPWIPHGLSSAFTWRPHFLPAAPIQCWAQRGCQSQAVSAHSGPSNRQSLCGECGSQSPR